MSWIEVVFEPLDVLTASDTRPMDTGGSAHAGAISPAAFAGLLRTAILRNMNFSFPRSEADFTREPTEAQQAAACVGHPMAEQPATFRFAGPFLLSLQGNRFVPLPRFATCREHNAAWKGRLRLSESTLLADEHFGDLAILSSDRDSTVDDRWADIETICHLLGAEAIADDENWKRAALRSRNYRETEFFREIERQWGHKRAESGVAEEAMLWSRPVERFHVAAEASGLRGAAYGGLVNGAGNFLPEDSFIARLAGDGHLVRVSMSHDESAWDAVARLRTLVTDTVRELRGLLLYVATPAIFENGWIPHELAAPGLRLRAAAVGRPAVIGGWDLVKGAPKPLVRAVPAGSTYFFVVEEVEAALRVVERYHWNEQLTLAGTEREGFGLMLCGVWDARRFFKGDS